MKSAKSEESERGIFGIDIWEKLQLLEQIVDMILSVAKPRKCIQMFR